MSNQRGAGVRNTTKTVFLTINNGNLVQRVKEPTATSKTRILEKGDNAGKQVHEEINNFVIGRLLSVKSKKSDQPINGAYLKSWQIELDTTHEGMISKAIIDISYASNLSNQFLLKLPNIDLEKDIMIMVGKGLDKEKNKDFYWLTVSQDKNNTGEFDTKIQPFYTKENPNGLPQLTKIKVKGEEKWDNSDQLEFLENKLVPRINEKLKALYNQSVAAEPATAEQATEESEDNGDLPF